VTPTVSESGEPSVGVAPTEEVGRERTGGTANLKLTTRMVWTRNAAT